MSHLRFDDVLRATITQNLSRLVAASPQPRGLKRAAVCLILADDGEGGAAVVLTRRAEHLSAHSGQYALPGGRVDAGESAAQAALREVREEAGPDLRVRPLAVVHASTFAYDARVTHMISVTFLMGHEAGEAVPGDDMRGSRVRWATIHEIESDQLRLVPPLDQPWLRQRTIDLYRISQPAPDVSLQKPLSDTGWNKHDDAG